MYCCCQPHGLYQQQPAVLQAAIEAEEINTQEKLFGWPTTKYGQVRSRASLDCSCAVQSAPPPWLLTSCRHSLHLLGSQGRMLMLDEQWIEQHESAALSAQYRQAWHTLLLMGS